MYYIIVSFYLIHPHSCSIITEIPHSNSNLHPRNSPLKASQHNQQISIISMSSNSHGKQRSQLHEAPLWTILRDCMKQHEVCHNEVGGKTTPQQGCGQVEKPKDLSYIYIYQLATLNHPRPISLQPFRPFPIRDLLTRFSSFHLSLCGIFVLQRCDSWPQRGIEPGSGENQKNGPWSPWCPGYREYQGNDNLHWPSSMLSYVGFVFL